MTQKELAKAVGMSEVYLSMILRGKRSGRKYMNDIIEVLKIRQVHTNIFMNNDSNRKDE